MTEPHLTREQFEAAELAVRRQIGARVFDPEELRLLDYVVERSFRLGRTAAYFRNFRQLGAATELYSHAHETLGRLVAKKVVAPLPGTTRRWHWYGFNLNFADWPMERKRPAAFWEEPSLPFERELQEMLTETFIENLSAEIRTPTSFKEMQRGRDAGPVAVPHSDSTAGSKSLPCAGLQPDSTSNLDALKEKVTKGHWERLKNAISRGTVDQEFPDHLPGPARSCPPFDCTPPGYKPENCTPTGYKNEVCTPPGYAFVPPEGTNGDSAKVCTPQGYSGNANVDGQRGAFVPPEGTSIAKLALGTKAKLATSSLEKSVAAYRWLEEIDISNGLKVKRFAEQWLQMCERHPDYVLNNLKFVLREQTKRDGQVKNPLALLAKVARQEGKMV